MAPERLLHEPATLRLRRRVARLNMPLAPRSIYHLSGEARHVWEHSIAAMEDTRWSITFRSPSSAGLAALRRTSPAIPVQR